MFNKGDRVVWTGLSRKFGTVHETQYHDYVEVDWDDGGALNPSKSCPGFVQLVNPPLISSELCHWILDNLLTEEQLSVIRKGDAHPIRMARDPIEGVDY